MVAESAIGNLYLAVFWPSFETAAADEILPIERGKISNLGFVKTHAWVKGRVDFQNFSTLRVRLKSFIVCLNDVDG